MKNGNSELWHATSTRALVCLPGDVALPLHVFCSSKLQDELSCCHPAHRERLLDPRVW